MTYMSRDMHPFSSVLARQGYLDWSRCLLPLSTFICSQEADAPVTSGSACSLDPDRRFDGWDGQ